MIDALSYNSYKQDFNIYRAKIISTNDTSGLGRVQLYIPAIHGTYDSEKISYPWAVCGIKVKNGDGVNVGFENGDTRVPLVLSKVVFEPEICYSGTTSSTTTTTGTYNAAGVNTLCTLFRELIVPYESDGDYGAISGDDNGAVAIGLIQWNGENAKEIIKEIISSGYTGYNGYSTSNSWSSFTCSKGDSNYTALYNAITSDIGKTVQDNKIIEWGTMYIEYGAETVGITDPAGMLFFMESANQGISKAGEIYKDSTDKTLDGLYNHLKNSHASSSWYTGGGFQTRRDEVYQTISSWASAGKIPDSIYSVNASTDSAGVIGGSASTYDSATPGSGKILWPTPGYTMISQEFGVANSDTDGYHHGIDIISGGSSNNEWGADTIQGACIYSAIAGTCTVSENGSNNGEITIQGTVGSAAFWIIHYHTQKSYVQKGDSVGRGQAIGEVGSVGYSTGPHLHFECHTPAYWTPSRSAVTVNPWKYIDTSTKSKSVVKSISEYSSASSNSNKLKASNSNSNSENKGYGTVSLSTNSVYSYTNCTWANENSSCTFILINKSHPLSKEYNPKFSYQCRKAFDKMAAAWETSSDYDGNTMEILSGYRSYSKQVDIYNDYKKMYGKAETDKLIARAGYSEHQTGDAFDLCSTTLEDWNSKYSKMLLWLKANCASYGFILRYPEGNYAYTGYNYKPWHYRFIGDTGGAIALCKLLMQNSISIEKAFDIESKYSS